MRHLVPHKLSPALARSVAQSAFAYYSERYARYHPELRWVSETRAHASFSAAGFSLRGTVELEPAAIAFELEVPRILRIFSGRAIALVDREVKHWTQAAQRGELPSG